ncbi:hypothetical protein ACLB1M_32300 [Escherichia coli]
MPEKTGVYWNSRFSIAPMLDGRTDIAAISCVCFPAIRCWCTTEMVTTGAIIHGKGDYLAYSEEEYLGSVATGR